MTQADSYLARAGLYDTAFSVVLIIKLLNGDADAFLYNPVLVGYGLLLGLAVAGYFVAFAEIVDVFFGLNLRFTALSALPETGTDLKT